MSHLLAGQGKHQPQLLGLEPLRRCLCPHSALNSCCALPDSSQGSIPARGCPADVPTGTQGCHQGWPWLPRELLSVFSLAAVTEQLGSALGARAMLRTGAFAGSSSSPLVPAAQCLLPGNSAGSGFPPADAQPAVMAGQTPHLLPCCRLCLTLH